MDRGVQIRGLRSFGVLLLLSAVFVGGSAAPSRSASVAACENVGWIAKLKAAAPQAYLRLAGKSCTCAAGCARVALNQRLFKNETMFSGGGSITFTSVVPGSPNLTCIAPRGAKNVLYPNPKGRGVGPHASAVLQVVSGATSCQVETGPLQKGTKDAVFIVGGTQLLVSSIMDPVFGIKAVKNGSLIQVKKGAVSVAASGHKFKKVLHDQQLVVRGGSGTVSPLALDPALRPGLCALTPKLAFTPLRTASGAHPNGNPLGIAPDANGNLWFTDNVTPAIGLYDLAAGKITYPLNGGLRPDSKPTFIVADPRGRLWFTDASPTQPAIGMIDPLAKTITEFSKGLRPGSIPWNPWYDATRGVVWFTDQSGAIGVLDPKTGSIVEYSRGLNAGSHPEGLVVDAAGTVWFTDDNGAGPAIGTLTVGRTAVIQEFGAGLVPGSLPRGITIDSAGTVWFADEREEDGLIGKVSTTDPKHQIVEYAVFANGGNRHSVPEGLTPYKGFIWFTDDGATKAIGRIDPATGAVTESNLAGSSQPIGVVVVNNVLWFTDRFANAPKIGRLEAKPSC